MTAADALALARILLFFAAFGLVPLASLLGQRPRLDLRTGSGADSVRDAVEAGDHAAKNLSNTFGARVGPNRPVA
jgi:hypothetical protein